MKKKENFKYLSEQFADLKIMRYQIPGFENLSLDQKKLIYYLSHAALAGRDIIFDQNYKYNLAVRKTLEEISKNYKGNRLSPVFQKFMVYLKRVWFSNGIHHHYSTDKFFPEISKEYFIELVKNSEEAEFPFHEGETSDMFIERISTVIFNPSIAPKRINQDAGVDMIASSACNYYDGVTEEEVETFYNKMKDIDDDTPVSYGLNSKLVKENGKLTEKIYSANCLYGDAIKQIILWLEKAVTVAENKKQRDGLKKLIE
ncbi:MAG: dihydrofolate reductase, partial [Bacteroidales bacterium]|nr:dihydrofolate reductase [Bacteroidales bacterium]